MNWKKAEDRLNMFIELYREIGWSGRFGIYLTLLPLKKRFDAGERTPELYEEIMACE